MNLRVDLILPDEKRTASVINVKGVIRILMIVVPAIIVVILGVSFMELVSLRSKRTNLEDNWNEKKPRKEAAAKLRGELAENSSLSSEVQASAKSRRSVYKQIVALQRLVPEDVQIRRLTITCANATLDNLPARNYTLSFDVLYTGSNGEVDIQTFKRKIEESPQLKDEIGKVSITDFRASNLPGAEKSHRLCGMSYTYRPRKVE